jgi:hypothetical protein
VGNLYSLNKKRDAVVRFFRVSHYRGEAFEPLSAILPGHLAPVIRQSADGEREIVRRELGSGNIRIVAAVEANTLTPLDRKGNVLTDQSDTSAAVHRA